MDTLGTRLMQLREARKWKRPEVVRQLKLVGVESSAESVRLYELGKAQPRKRVIAGLAMIFSTTEKYLLYGEENHPLHVPIGGVNKDVVNALIGSIERDLKALKMICGANVTDERVKESGFAYIPKRKDDK